MTRPTTAVRLKFFTVPIRDLASSNTELDSFLSCHRVLQVEKRFVELGQDSFWALSVEFVGGALPVSAASAQKPPKVDYREELTEEEFEVFSKVRDWRKVAADKEGIPVYAVLTNKQIAEIVQKRVSTRSQLQEVEGIGEGRAQKYAEHILPLLVFSPVPP